MIDWGRVVFWFRVDFFFVLMFWYWGCVSIFYDEVCLFVVLDGVFWNSYFLFLGKGNGESERVGRDFFYFRLY